MLRLVLAALLPIAALSAQTVTAVKVADGCGGEVRWPWVDPKSNEVSWRYPYVSSFILIGPRLATPFHLPFWPGWAPGCTLAVDPWITAYSGNGGGFFLGYMPPSTKAPLWPIGFPITIQEVNATRGVLPDAWEVTVH